MRGLLNKKQLTAMLLGKVHQLLLSHAIYALDATIALAGRQAIAFATISASECHVDALRWITLPQSI